ncbi:hypothetical protein GCM10009776_37350 [Microbacterium deminutum]|uniref:Uncharacterized protein n=1 Tax=Microbacterium deminutum TaxID=344164 RepID=A0ABP5CYW4_9MICO
MGVGSDRGFNPYSAVTLLVTAVLFTVTFVVCRQVFRLDAEITGLITSLVTLASPVIAYQLHARRQPRTQEIESLRRASIDRPIALVTAILVGSLLLAEQLLGLGVGVVVTTTVGVAMDDFYRYFHRALGPLKTGLADVGAQLGGGGYSGLSVVVANAVVPYLMLVVTFFAARRAGLYFRARPELWVAIGVVGYIVLSTVLTIALGYSLSLNFPAIIFYAAVLPIAVLGAWLSRATRVSFLASRLFRLLPSEDRLAVLELLGESVLHTEGRTTNRR